MEVEEEEEEDSVVQEEEIGLDWTRSLQRRADSHHDALHRVERQRVRHLLAQRMMQLPRSQILQSVRELAHTLFYECLDRTLLQRWSHDYIFRHSTGPQQQGLSLCPERFQSLFFTVLFSPLALTVRGQRLTLFQTWDRTEELLVVRRDDLTADQWQAVHFLQQFPQTFFSHCHVPNLPSEPLHLTGFRYNYWLDLEFPRRRLLERLMFCLTINVAMAQLNQHRGPVSEERMRSQIYLCCNLMRQGLDQARTQFVLLREQQDMTRLSPLFRRARTESESEPADDLELVEQIFSQEQQRSPEFRRFLLQELLQEIQDTQNRLASEAYTSAVVGTLIHIRRQNQHLFDNDDNTTQSAPGPQRTSSSFAPDPFVD